MLDKFKKIKDKNYFYQILAKETRCNPHSIKNNWFKKLFCSVPKPYVEITENTIIKMQCYEIEHTAMSEKLRTKHFGK